MPTHERHLVTLVLLLNVDILAFFSSAQVADQHGLEFDSKLDNLGNLKIRQEVVAENKVDVKTREAVAVPAGGAAPGAFSFSIGVFAQFSHAAVA